jgi:hypothetical protein
MGLLLIVSGIAALLGLVAAVAVFWIVRRLHRPRWAVAMAIVAGLLAFCISLGPVFDQVISATKTIIVGDSSDVADSVMAFLEMPPGTATDFSYRRSLGGISFVADFQMKEDDYLKWMGSREWPVTRIAEDGVEVYSVRGFETAESSPLQVKHGWRYYWRNPDHPDNTRSLTFDAETGRVYVLLTSW